MIFVHISKLFFSDEKITLKVGGFSEFLGYRVEGYDCEASQ